MAEPGPQVPGVLAPPPPPPHPAQAEQQAPLPQGQHAQPAQQGAANNTSELILF